VRGEPYPSTLESRKGWTNQRALLEMVGVKAIRRNNARKSILLAAGDLVSEDHPLCGQVLGTLWFVLLRWEPDEGKERERPSPNTIRRGIHAGTLHYYKKVKVRLKKGWGSVDEGVG